MEVYLFSGYQKQQIRTFPKYLLTSFEVRKQIEWIKPSIRRKYITNVNETVKVSVRADISVGTVTVFLRLHFITENLRISASIIGNLFLICSVCTGFVSLFNIHGLYCWRGVSYLLRIDFQNLFAKPPNKTFKALKSEKLNS